MKPVDLYNPQNSYGHSYTESTISRYNFKDVVTAYIKNSFGVAFLIKGKIKDFAFVFLNSPYHDGYNLQMIKIQDFFKAFENAREEEKVIVDNKALKQIKAKQMLRELNN